MTDAAHEWPLGERLQQARGGESQRSVAERAGISPEMLWQLENGRRRDGRQLKRPSPELIMQVARAVQVPAAEALRLAGFKPEHHLAGSAEGLEAELARKMAKLRPEEQRALEVLVDGLLVNRGYLTAGAAVDVVVHSAGEDVHPVVQSSGEPLDDSARQPQRD